MKLRNSKGFTLIELLVVVGIIAILFAVVLVAIDPAKRLRQSRDSTRRQDVNNILEAIQEYIVDNNGTYPVGAGSVSMDTTYRVLGTNTAAGCNVTACGYTGATVSPAGACLDLSSSLVPTYLASIPLDPSNGNATNTRYAVMKNSAGRVQVLSCDAEGSTVSVQR